MNVAAWTERQKLRDRQSRTAVSARALIEALRALSLAAMPGTADPDGGLRTIQMTPVTRPRQRNWPRHIVHPKPHQTRHHVLRTIIVKPTTLADPRVFLPGAARSTSRCPFSSWRTDGHDL